MFAIPMYYVARKKLKNTQPFAFDSLKLQSLKARKVAATPGRWGLGLGSSEVEQQKIQNNPFRRLFSKANKKTTN